MRALSVVTVAIALLVPPPADAKPRKKKEPPKMAVKEAPAGDLFATFQTSAGDIIVKLYEKEAPKTVENFVGLATGKKEWKHPGTEKWQTDRPLYDNTAFHRVIPRFMIQGGDPFSSSVDGTPERAGSGNPGYRFADEHNGKTFDKPGYLAMANSGPDTNGSQWFITEVKTPHLDGKHTIFGEVVSGMELVPQIAASGNMTTKLNKVVITRGKLVATK
jgi:peptidyl-prolyl cis-trans isomerase A (cyclophilin A)